MAWNGSSAQSAPASVPSKPKKSPSWLRGAFAGGLVVVVAVIALFFISSPNEEPVVEKKGPGAIEDIKPVAVPVSNIVEEVKQTVIDPNARPTKVGECVNGYVLLPSGRMHRRTGVITNSIAGRPKGKYAIFDRSCNNEIACYLTLKPGDTLIGTPRYNGRFKKDFLESLKEPIIVLDNDTPEQAQLKRDVIAARLTLKEAMDRGEDIEKIMLDTRQELQDLMRAKMEYRKLFYEEKKNCETDQDIEDLLNACNKMLEEKGVAPLTYGPITKRNLLRQQLNEGSN